MTFMESVRHVLSNYANFEGRAVRSEYWWFVLFYLLAQFVGAYRQERLVATHLDCSNHRISCAPVLFRATGH